LNRGVYVMSKLIDESLELRRLLSRVATKKQQHLYGISILAGLVLIALFVFGIIR
jgi:hypothetical protein